MRVSSAKKTTKRGEEWEPSKDVQLFCHNGYAYAECKHTCEELHGKVFYDKLMTCYKHKISSLEIKWLKMFHKCQFISMNVWVGFFVFIFYYNRIIL